MTSSTVTLKALGARLARPGQAVGNRVRARRACLGGRPEAAESLPDAILSGDADKGQALVAGHWQARGRSVSVAPHTIWDASLPGPAFEAERQACLWLDDLAAFGTRAARGLAQAWVQEWIRRFGSGRGPGWQPAIAGRRAKRWTAHAAMLTHGLDDADADRFWRALAAQQRYLERSWTRAAPGLPRLRALAGLVWTGVVLPHARHGAALGNLASLADALVDKDGGVANRSPEDLAEVLILLVWTARLIEDAGQHAMAPHLAAIARAVPVIRPLRLGDGRLARFHGGGAGSVEALDHALAELRLGVQPKPRQPMGYVRMSGGRVSLVLDGDAPPQGAHAVSANAGTLAFEMSIGRQPFVVNSGAGGDFGPDWAHYSRQTAAHSTVEVDARSSARIVASGIATRTFGSRLEHGPTLVSVKQAHDATGQWLLATHDGYVASHGLLHERRILIGARGTEARGEEILTVTDARARAQFDRVAQRRPIGLAARFHLHPDIGTEFDAVRQLVVLRLPSGEVWVFRAAGGFVDLEGSIYFDPAHAAPLETKQVVVRAEVVEYLGQITWSFGRIAEAPPADL